MVSGRGAKESGSVHRLLPGRPVETARREDLRRLPRLALLVPQRGGRTQRDHCGRLDATPRPQRHPDADHRAPQSSPGRRRQVHPQLDRQSPQNQGTRPSVTILTGQIVLFDQFIPTHIHTLLVC